MILYRRVDPAPPVIAIYGDIGSTKLERLHLGQKEIHQLQKPIFDAAMPKPKKETTAA
jgi:hypothetical protein